MEFHHIHIFNPETDYALAAGNSHYNPPAKIVSLRRSMALFPATYAGTGDTILLIDPLADEEILSSEYSQLVSEKHISLIPIRNLRSYLLELGAIPVFRPWGWNHSLRNSLIGYGVDPSYLKNECEIDSLRTLSHRRTCIPFQQGLSALLPEMGITPASEFSDLEEAIGFFHAAPHAWFKMPWSSSGRGVVCAESMGEDKLRQWLHGAIKRQGSVIGEPGYERTGDFATEWFCHKGKAIFAGLSFFETSSDGRYEGNAIIPQEEINDRLKRLSPFWNRDVVLAQQELIESMIAPQYEGPMGIDMLTDTHGRLNPCVEINLRMTMGMAALLKSQTSILPSGIL